MIKIATQADADRINYIANHDSVFPFINVNGEPIDLSSAIDAHTFFISKHGGIVFENLGGGTYSFHTMFLPEGRGRHALKVAKLCAAEMFFGTLAMELVTASPDDAPHSKPPKTFGFRPWFRREKYIRDTGATFYRLHINDWIVKSKLCGKEGDAFHDKLHDFRPENVEHEHEEEGVHNRFVGAACFMAKANNIDKGLMIYNSWAGTAGYTPGAVVSRSPLTVNTGDALWSLNDGELEITKCLLE